MNIIDNEDGGVIYSSSNISIYHCNISSNSGDKNGGVVYINSNSLNIYDSIFDNNYAEVLYYYIDY